jgi:hypothetical protein
MCVFILLDFVDRLSFILIENDKISEYGFDTIMGPSGALVGRPPSLRLYVSPKCWHMATQQTSSGTLTVVSTSYLIYQSSFLIPVKVK